MKASKQDITRGNDLIRIFMGYKFHKQVLVDFSDCGGIYDRVDIYSKVPIEYTEYDEEQIYLEDKWWSNNYNEFFYKDKDNVCLYNTSWEWLMPVAKKCMDTLDTVSEEISEYLFVSGYAINKALLEFNIEKLWKAVVVFIEKYNEIWLVNQK